MVRSSTAQPRPDARSRPRIRHTPIDRVHLARQTLGDPGLEQEVLRMFDEMSRVYYGRIERSTSAEELLHHLHALKGAAAGIGARAIADIAGTAEAELRAGAPVNPERIDDLGVAVEEARAYIAELVGEDDE